MDWQEQDRQSLELIDRAGPALAAALGKGWSFVPGWSDDAKTRRAERHFELQRADGVRLHFAREWNSKGQHFNVSGVYACGGHGNPTAGVNLTRPAGDLARDIKRRVLKDIERLTFERFQEVAKKEQEHQRRLDKAWELALALGKEPKPDPRRSNTWVFDEQTGYKANYGYQDSLTVKVEDSGEGSIDIGITNVSMPLALELMRMLRAYYVMNRKPAPDEEIRVGDRVRIICQGRRRIGVVTSANPNRAYAGAPADWYLEVDTEDGPIYWKQGVDGGSVRKLEVD